MVAVKQKSGSEGENKVYSERWRGRLEKPILRRNKQLFCSLWQLRLSLATTIVTNFWIFFLSVFLNREVKSSYWELTSGYQALTQVCLMIVTGVGEIMNIWISYIWTSEQINIEVIFTVKYETSAVAKRKPEKPLVCSIYFVEKIMRKEDEFCDNLVLRTNK